MAKIATVVVALGLLAAVSAIPKLQRKVSPERIVGGQNAELGKLPYQVFIIQPQSPMLICSGALVTLKGQQVIVTAAHRIDPALTYRVVAGDVDRIYYNGNEQTRNITRVIIHENYDELTLANDIAVLIIETPFELNTYVKPITLPEQGQETHGKVYVSGWGTNSSDGTPARYLKYVQIPVIDDETCQIAYEGKPILESMLCAGTLGERGNTCRGDSGGPVRGVALKDGWLPYYYLAGIISGGYGCGNGRYPGINTEVSYFIDWLNAQV